MTKWEWAQGRKKYRDEIWSLKYGQKWRAMFMRQWKLSMEGQCGSDYIVNHSDYIVNHSMWDHASMWQRWWPNGEWIVNNNVGHQRLSSFATAASCSCLAAALGQQATLPCKPQMCTTQTCTSLPCTTLQWASSNRTDVSHFTAWISNAPACQLYNSVLHNSALSYF